MLKKFYIGWIIFFAFTILATGKDYKGAEYRTIDAFTYGRFETRYKPMPGDGYLASFFTYHEIETSAEWNEIDFEIMCRYDHDVQVSSIGPGQATRNSHQFVPFNTHDDFHTYAFEWTPDYIAWFIDDLEVYRQTGAFISGFQFPQKIMMNIWPPNWEPWAGHLDDSILPVFAYYDYGSYASYTPGTGTLGTDNNFTLQWKDEFDSWDQERWEKATHTWGGNNCDFVQENAVLKDGMLILCLTKTTPLGFIDKSAPGVLWVRGYQNTVSVHFSEPVELNSAQTSTNYIISGIPVLQAIRLEDQCTVELTVNGMDAQGSYNLIALGIKDQSLSANMLTGAVVPITMVQPLTFPVKINIGGSAVGDYLADQVWDPRLEYGHQDGYVESWSDTTQIHNTDEDVIYRSGLHELVFYKIRLPNGHYKVTIMLCENDKVVLSRLRVFEIIVEDTKVASQLNLYEQVGFHTAYNILLDDVEVTDQMLDVHFTNLWNFSLLNGLVVEQLSTDLGRSGEEMPGKYYLGQNYPNPFNLTTVIPFKTPFPGMVRIGIYDLLGREIKVLLDERMPPGIHQVTFDGRDLASGIYYYRIKSINEQAEYNNTRKMLMLK